MKRSSGISCLHLVHFYGGARGKGDVDREREVGTCIMSIHDPFKANGSVGVYAGKEPQHWYNSTSHQSFT
jgi:hypothetical protein